MSNTKLYPFYYPWPNLGIKLSRQWENLRDNTEKEAPLIRAAYVDAQPVSANAPGEHDLSGWAIGERDFRNRFRIWYDKGYDRFSIQYNCGTESVEVWVDYLSIRQDDGRVTVHGDGGLDSSVGGFYTPIPRNAAKSGDFTAPSREWVFNHLLNTKPIVWNTYNLEDKSITPQSVDVSDPNTAYFYFATDQSGRVIAVGEQARPTGITVTDGTNTYDDAGRLSFNNNDFYLSRGSCGEPVVNLAPVDLSSLAHSDLAGLSADDHTQYARTDGSRTITGDQRFASDIVVSDKVVAGSFYSNTFGEVAYADQGYLSVVQTDGASVYSTVNRLTFEQANFYITPDSNGMPVINFRGDGGGGGGSFGTGILSQSFASSVEWQFNHGLGVTNLIWAAYDDQGEAIIPDKVATSDSNLTYFYFSTATQGRAVVAGGPLVNTITVAETDGNPPSVNSGRLTFNSDSFYLTTDSNDRPIVNFRGTAGSGSATDHGTLTGLGDDDHTQYSLVSGSRPFTGTVGGVTPVAGSDLATKDYVDQASGGGFYGVYFRESDGNPPTFRNDTVIFDSAYFYLHPNSVGKPTVSLRGDTISDHGTLTGLTDDDHTQYSLSDGTRAYTGVVSGITPTTSTHLATKGYVDSAIGPGFYGLIIKESDNTPPPFRTDTLTFNSENFYISSRTGKPVVNFRAIDEPGATALSQNYGIQPEWIFEHSLNSSNLVWATYDNRQIAIIPEKVDVSDPNVAYFYFVPAIAGRAVVLGGLDTAGQVGNETGITTVRDGSSTYNNQVLLNFSHRDFYLSPGGPAGSAVVNLTSRYIDYIQGFIETASVMNLAIEPWAPYGYRLNHVNIDCREGSCVGGFYLLRKPDRSSNTVWNGHSTGVSISGLDPLTVSTTAQKATPSTNIDVQEGDCIIFSVGENSAAKWIRLSIQAERL